MLKLLGGGGLGDACMCMAKVFSKNAPFDFSKNALHLTHVTNKRGKGEFANAIYNLYLSQGIENRVQLDERGGGWIRAHGNEFDYYLGSHWSAQNDDSVSWEINPFPPTQYEKIEGIDIVFGPFGGWNLSRTISIEEIKTFDSKNISYIGALPKYIEKQFSDLKGSNLFNTGIINSINIIGSANTVIGQEGFTTFFGAMCKKKVYIFPNKDRLTSGRLHPDWDITIIKTLKEIKFKNE